ncbi:CFEM domain protein, partial [Metarhizium brunneum ARSEF 3297]
MMPLSMKLAGLVWCTALRAAGSPGPLGVATAFDGIIATNVPTSTSTSSSSTSSKTVSTPKSTPATTTTTTTPTAKPSWTGPTAVSDLPQCGQTCINNMLAKHRELGCGDKGVACMCRAPNFNYGIRDCANGACSNEDRASTVISFETSYWCPSFMATGTNSPTQTPTPTPTATSDLPPCGVSAYAAPFPRGDGTLANKGIQQTCMNNMIAQYSQLGCRSLDSACLCKNANFGYGVRDCANGA